MNERDDFPDVRHRLDARISSRVYADWNISCTGPAGGQPQGSCSGDCGGLLAVKDATGTVWLQAGIVHTGIGECGENPGIYTKVSGPWRS